MTPIRDIDRALSNVRSTFDRVADEAESMTEEAKQEVREAIDDVETEIEKLKDRS